MAKPDRMERRFDNAVLESAISIEQDPDTTDTEQAGAIARIEDYQQKYPPQSPQS